MQHSGTEVFDELDLSCRITRCSRYCQHAYALGSVLEAKTGREHTVAGRVLEHIFRA